MNKLLLCAALLFPLGVLYAIDEPSLKEGLWSVHTQTIQNPGNKKDQGDKSICRSHAFDEHVQSLAKKVNCKSISENSSGGTKTTETECTVGGSVIKGKGTVTMSGDTAAHSESHATYTPPMYGMSETTMITDQKYLGACPAGTQPGDIIFSDGRITHTWNH